MLGIIHNRFELKKKLGKGGQGEVWLALDTQTTLEVVVKIHSLYPWELDKPEENEDYLRFENEWEISKKLIHNRNVATVIEHEIDKEQRIVWLAREYLPGYQLKELIKQPPIEFEKAKQIIFSIAEVLEDLHAANVYHRDIKPSNIFIQGRHPVLIDFGLAYSAGEDRISRTGYTSGTSAYKSPELLDEMTVDKYAYTYHRDWWALGVVAYELFTGRYLFKERESSFTESCIRLGDEQGIIEKELAGHPGYNIVKGLMERTPEKRVKSADDLQKIFKAYEAERQDKVQQEITKKAIEAQAKRDSRIQELEDQLNQAQKDLKDINKDHQQTLKQIENLKKEKEKIESGPNSFAVRNNRSPVTEKENVKKVPFLSTSKPGQNYSIDLDAGVQLDVIWIPAGSFMMGSHKSEKGRSDNEGPQTNVNSEGFWMGKYQVTQAQYQAIMGTNPSYFKGANIPVEQVSWNDVMEFCRKLSERTGQNFTLPTEAQWEYSCRAGTTTAYSFGNDSNQLGSYAWYGSNSNSTTHPVGQKQPNSWGLYDMHGNVWEWCLSLYKDYPYIETDGRNSLTDTSGARVLRGGSWINIPEYCRCASRAGFNPSARIDDNGFRCARTL